MCLLFCGEKLVSASHLSHTDLVTKMYISIPVTFLLVSIDWLSGSHVVNALPHVPEAWLLFNFFFNLLHIVESNILLLDKEVLNVYGTRLGYALLLGSIATLLLNYKLKWEVFLYLHTLWALKHIVLQQFNLSYGVGVKRTWLPLVWKVIGVICGVAVYWDVYDMFSLKFNETHRYLLNYLFYIFIFISGMMMWTYKKTKSFPIVLGNSSLIIFGYLMYKMGAGFFSALLFRVIHDCTGFIYYHALNKGRRNAGVSPQWYNWLSKWITDWGVTLLLPLLIVGIIFALPFRPEAKAFVIIISILHHYSESFTWKKDSPYRKYL